MVLGRHGIVGRDEDRPGFGGHGPGCRVIGIEAADNKAATPEIEDDRERAFAFRCVDAGGARAAGAGIGHVSRADPRYFGRNAICLHDHRRRLRHPRLGAGLLDRAALDGLGVESLQRIEHACHVRVRAGARVQPEDVTDCLDDIHALNPAACPRRIAAGSTGLTFPGAAVFQPDAEAPSRACDRWFRA
jgi:hypothetical protein